MESSDPIVILRSSNRDGATFALEPDSRIRLQATFGEIFHHRSRVFIAHDRMKDLDQVQEAIIEPVLMILTRLSEKQLAEVVFRDAATDEELPRSA